MYRWMLLLLLACPFSVSAQMVRGRVVDASTGIAIKAADISLLTAEGQRVGRAMSDDNGKFELVLPKGRAVYLQAALIGYETVLSKSITAKTSELLDLSVRLSVVAIALQGVEVVTRRKIDPRLQPFLDRASRYKQAGIGHIWTRSELALRHPALVSHVLDNWVPKRAPRNCKGRSIFIDDLPVEIEDIDLLVGPEMLEGVEIYNDIDVPPDLLMQALSVGKRPDQRTERSAAVVPPCETVLLWRKAYGDHPRMEGESYSLVRRLLAGAVFAGVLVLEYLAW